MPTPRSGPVTDQSTSMWAVKGMWLLRTSRKSNTSCWGRSTTTALTIMNGNYLLDALVREPRQDPETALETLMTVWTGTLGMRAPGSHG